jgi:hypothetical protein
VTASPKLSPQAKAFCTWLTRWSDNELKQVWGDQQGMAKKFGRAASQLRRYTHEAEGAGFLKVIRCAPERDDFTGQYCRRHTNKYSFINVPPPARKKQGQSCKSRLSPTGRRINSSLTGTSNKNLTKEESSPKPQRYRPHDEHDPEPFADPNGKKRIQDARNAIWRRQGART